MQTYRCYEASRNAGGGLDPLGTDWESVEAATATEAAEKAAESRKHIPEMDGTVIVATDDDGEEATCDVDQRQVATVWWDDGWCYEILREAGGRDRTVVDYGQACDAMVAIDQFAEDERDEICAAIRDAYPGVLIDE